MTKPSPALLGQEDRIDELLTRVEYGAEQFQLGFLFCENKSLLTVFETRFDTRLSDEPTTNTMLFSAWRAQAGQPFAANALEWLRFARGKPGVYWLDLHAGSELEIRKLLGLLNERRSELVDSISGLLLIVMRNNFGGEIRALVPDLWSVRSFSMTLSDQFAPAFTLVMDGPIVSQIFDHQGIGSAAAEPEVLIRRARECANRDLAPALAISIAEAVLSKANLLVGERFERITFEAGIILDDLLAFNQAASAFHMLIASFDSVDDDKKFSMCRWTRKLSENLLASGKTKEAALAMTKGVEFAEFAVERDALLFAQTASEIALAERKFGLAERGLLKVLKQSTGQGSAAEVRASASLAELFTQTGDIRSALSFSQLALLQSQARIDKRGLRPARALRHVKLLNLQHRIAQLRGDPIASPEEIPQFLEKAIASFGPVPVIVALKAQLQRDLGALTL